MGLAVFLLFAAGSWAGHLVGGWLAYAGDQAAHGEPDLSLMEFLGSSRFWFEFFQN